MIDYNCSECGEAMQSPGSASGQTETCPACGASANVPPVSSKPLGGLAIGFFIRRPHLIPAVVAAAMLFGAIGKRPYAYCQLMRWVVCAVAVFVAYNAWTFKRPWVVWVFGFVAVLFNPLVPIHMQRDTWQVIDLLVAGAFVAVTVVLARPATPR